MRQKKIPPIIIDGTGKKNFFTIGVQKNNNNKTTITNTHTKRRVIFFTLFFCCFFCVCVCVLRVWRDYENIFRVPGLFILTKTHNNIYMMMMDPHTAPTITITQYDDYDDDEMVN